jgi:hypothetical protein
MLLLEKASQALSELIFNQTVGYLKFSTERLSQPSSSAPTKIHWTQIRNGCARQIWSLQSGCKCDVANLRLHLPRGKILERLEARDVKRAEIFFLTAKHLRDPVCGLEDGNFGAVQSLLLVTIFMLTVAKRNTAWVCLGM